MKIGVTKVLNETELTKLLKDNIFRDVNVGIPWSDNDITIDFSEFIDNNYPHDRKVTCLLILDK